MNYMKDPFTSIGQLHTGYRPKTYQEKNQTTTDFGAVLEQTRENQTSTELNFSKHAVNRLRQRNITLSAEQKSRLENGVKKASEKGINESLIMIDSLAFIVNIPNKTVITAMDQMESDDSIFTNIDGAVIM